MVGGATRTCTVDVAAPALAWAEEQVRALGGRGDEGQHEFVRADVFGWLRAQPPRPLMSLADAVAAGGLLAQTTGFASLDVFDFHRSADVMLALIIGGAGWLWGGLVGAIAFKVMHDVISAFTAQYWTFWIGLFLVLLMLIGRDRLFRPWTWFMRGRA